MDNTEIVRLWLYGDEPTYRTCLYLAKGVDRHKAAQRIRAMVESFTPTVTGMFSELLTRALQDVDWDDIGSEFAEEAKERAGN